MKRLRAWMIIASVECGSHRQAALRGNSAMRGPQKLFVAAVWLLTFLAAPSVQARDLVVFGEPTLATALERLGAAWRERSGVRVNVFVAPSDLSLAQIYRGRGAMSFLPWLVR